MFICPMNLTFLVALALTASSVLANQKTVKVFILAGQSNMEGQAVVELKGPDYNDGKGTLETFMSDPRDASKFRHLKGADGRWTVRDDVWVRYQRESQPLL